MGYTFDDGRNNVGKCKLHYLRTWWSDCATGVLYDGKNVTLHFDVCWYDVGTSWSKLHLYSGFSVISETWAAAIGKCNLHFWRRGGIKGGVISEPSVPCRTSIVTICAQCLLDLNCDLLWPLFSDLSPEIECEKKCQKICQKECQTKCQRICQK